MSPLLSIRDLNIAFSDKSGAGRRVVTGVNLDVARGSFTALIGESGSGKSLTCLSVLGLIDPAAHVEGRISFEGASFRAGERKAAEGLRGRHIGMIFQDPVASLNPVRSIGAQLFETIRVHDRNISRDSARTLAISLLDRVGLDRAPQRFKQFPHELSGGMNQRVMIELALASKPQLLIADEPTTALDARIQRQVMDLIDDLRRTEGLSVLLVSHDLGLVWDYADAIYIMRAGQIVESGAIDELAQRPQLHPYAEELTRAAGLWA